MRKTINTSASTITETYSKDTSNTKQTRIIAIGASAGGLEALKAFFEHVPDDSQNSYIVIQHLSPDYKSMMGELLKRNTRLPIKKVADQMEVKPGTIYLIPPANNLLLGDGRLFLKEKPKSQTLNLPIDIFFESLAKERKEKAIGVILSGTGSDGTRGARAIKESGGMIMVQEPEESQFDGMPQSVINTGLVDYVIPVRNMGCELHNFISAPEVWHFEDGEAEYDRSELLKILNYVNKETGFDFREYKRSTMARRVARRVNVCKCRSLAEYYDFLISHEEEVEVLYREFLIGVTRFFRDNKVWELLREKIIPGLVSRKNEGETLKLWDVACSTGEEAYSYAICIFEEMEKQNKNIKLKIFATDISEKHLETGSTGTYPESIAADVPMDFLAKYFLNKPHSYRVVEKIRRSVIFSRHNVIKNPPFSNMDMVSCRNLLIYFQPAIQKKTLGFLHYSLKQDGILVLGTSESVQSHRQNFVEIDRKWKIYSNVNPSKRLNSTVSHAATSSLPDYNRPKDLATERTTIQPLKKKMNNEFRETILEHFKGASIFVDTDYHIIEAIGEFRKYANLPLSGFSINLLDMLETDLQNLVLNTFRKARKLQKKIYYKDAIFNHNGEKKRVDIIVKPFAQQDLERDAHFVITFIEKELNLDDAQVVDNTTLTSRTKEYVSSLEEELKQTREELQTSLEVIETSNEELQTANEELLTSNEELQSTNEELQSVNEEINTVNAENIQKMDDLAALNADMNNLLDSTQIGTIFLDSSLLIRKFTPAIREHFSFLDSDIGRPISHFTRNIGKNKLLDRCKKVLSTGKPLEKAIISKNGIHYLRRLYPYRDSSQKVSGVVITFIDIDLLQRSKEHLLASERRYRSFYEEDPMMHISVDPQSYLIVQCNQMTVKQLEFQSREDLVGRPIYELYSEDSQVEAIRLNKEFQKKGRLVNLEQKLLTKSGKALPVILNATAERDENDRIITIRYTFADISALKEAEEKLQKQKADLKRANRDLEQFVSICSHDLQEPLSTIKFGSDVLRKVYSQKLDDKGKNYINYIEEASSRLSHQIKALLEHSRIGRNGKRKSVDTKELVEIVKYDLGKSIKDTGAKIHCGELPTLKGYKVELRLLFQNLISNAIKYTPGNRVPEVRISAYREANYWVFSVVDNGVGISKEDRLNIFTIFSRVENDNKKDGTGVGLAHVEKIVHLHEGTLWVDSQVDVGSSFYFKLKAE